MEVGVFPQGLRYEKHREFSELLNAQSALAHDRESLENLLQHTAFPLFEEVLSVEFPTKRIYSHFLDEVKSFFITNERLRKHSDMYQSLDEVTVANLEETYQKMAADALPILASIHHQSIYEAIHQVGNRSVSSNGENPFGETDTLMNILNMSAFSSGKHYPKLPRKMAEIFVRYSRDQKIFLLLPLLGTIGSPLYERGPHQEEDHTHMMVYQSILDLDTSLEPHEFRKSLRQFFPSEHKN